MTTKVCKRHQREPVHINGQCIGCEIEYYQKKLNEKDNEIAQLKIDLNKFKEDQIEQI